MSARGKLKAPIVAALVGAVLLLAGAPASAASPNDDIADAKVISSFPFRDTLDTSGATTATDDPDCFGNAATVWYVFTATTDTVMQLSTFSSDYGVTLSVYTGTRGALEQVACVDTRTLTVEVPKGRTVYVMAGAGPPRTTGGRLSLGAVCLPPHHDIAKAKVISRLPYADSSHLVGRRRGRVLGGAVVVPDRSDERHVDTRRDGALRVVPGLEGKPWQLA